MLPAAFWIVIAITAGAIVACVILHYEALRLISDRLPTPTHHHRRRVVFLMLCLIVVHIIEIWIFAFVYFGLMQAGGFGELAGLGDYSLFNCVYYSAVVFTTLGFGDVVPFGPVRFVTGTEAVAGLTFITWSASYTIIDMMHTWDGDREARKRATEEDTVG